MVEGLPGDKFHDHEIDAALATDVMQNTDIGMLQGGDGLGFLLEAGAKSGI